MRLRLSLTYSFPFFLWTLRKNSKLLEKKIFFQTIYPVNHFETVINALFTVCTGFQIFRIKYCLKKLECPCSYTLISTETKTDFEVSKYRPFFLYRSPCVRSFMEWWLQAKSLVEEMFVLSLTWVHRHANYFTDMSVWGRNHLVWFLNQFSIEEKINKTYLNKHQLRSSNLLLRYTCVSFSQPLRVF